MSKKTFAKTSLICLLLSLLLSLLALLSACEETPESATVPSSQPQAAVAGGSKPQEIEAMTEHLAGGYGRKWKLLKRFSNGDDVTEDCYRDDFAEIYRDHRITFNVGNLPCVKDGLVERTQTGRWQPTSTFDMLVFTNAQPSFPVRILELTDKSLVMRIIDLDGSEIVESFSRGDDIKETTAGPAPAQSPNQAPNQPISGPPVILPPE